MVSRVASWPPWRLEVDVKTPAGLPARAPLSHRGAGAVEEILERGGHVAEAGGAPQGESGAVAQVLMGDIGGAGGWDPRCHGLTDGGDGRYGPQAGLDSLDGLDPAGDLPGQFGGCPVAAVVEDEDVAQREPHRVFAVAPGG